jgi:hypothetical protein
VVPLIGGSDVEVLVVDDVVAVVLVDVLVDVLMDVDVVDVLVVLDVVLLDVDEEVVVLLVDVVDGETHVTESLGRLDGVPASLLSNRKRLLCVPSASWPRRSRSQPPGRVSAS